jgi:NSS family neurotransmitter:Na+ symporter
VSILATLVIFPLVFRYGLNPAQGPELVFEVLPTAFAEMPAGRLVGTLFFALLVLAALTPSIGMLEPAVAWLEQSGFKRPRAVWLTVLTAWGLGVGSVLSFNHWADWRPLHMIPPLAQLNFFNLVDFVSADIILPVGAFLTSLLVGWRLWDPLVAEAMVESERRISGLLRLLLCFVCPSAILAVMIAAFA